MQELYDECKKMNFDQTSDILEKARSEEEARFFALVCDLILQQKQEEVIAAKRF
ncbi:MAG: hypothetical protein MJY87_06455 [Fibrobacter sp.]|nr:hypothetical protein [Fibrobacter sp.]